MADKDTRSPEEKGIDAARQRHAGEKYARSHYGAERRAWRIGDALDTFAARVAVADHAASMGRKVSGERVTDGKGPTGPAPSTGDVTSAASV